MSVPVSELQKLAPSAIIELFEIHLVTEIHGANTVFRFHAGTNAINNGNIVWAGNSYQAFPVEATGFEYNGNGQLPRPRLIISNVLRFVTSILLVVNETSPGNDLNGAKFIRIRTLSRYLDAANFSGGNANADPTAEFPREIYYLDRKVVETRAAVEWELLAHLTWLALEHRNGNVSQTYANGYIALLNAVTPQRHTLMQITTQLDLLLLMYAVNGLRVAPLGLALQPSYRLDRILALDYLRDELAVFSIKLCQSCSAKRIMRASC